MQEKELRLGVVLTGGVSLAVYMHGVSKELNKLVRASRAYHMREHDDGRVPDAYRDTSEGREVDTERVYFDLLKSFSPQLDLRIVIDVIAGASAGGVNGVMLARALAHDLDLDPHRQMWLEHADVTQLIDERSSAGRWGKIYIWPLVGLLLRGRLRAMAPEKETQEKLRSFMRSRWSRPPFSGFRYASRLLEACDAMDRNAPVNGSLMPEGHPLELFVSVADFHGHINRIALHDPPEIEELDHRHVLQFRYVKAPDGEVSTDFGAESTPGLAFAARATSCFPGAFSPASLGEIDKVLEHRGRAWTTRDKFVADKLATFVARGQDVDSIRFIDGSVVNDKPFGAAISAIRGRSANREAIRRILFVQPSPIDSVSAEDRAEPGFFRTILASLAEIPRNEPIHDDLARVNAFNRQINLIRQVVRNVQPQIDFSVNAILPSPEAVLRPTQAEIAGWRKTANEQAAEQAGYAFESYFRIKVLRVAARLETLIAGLAWPEAVHDLPVADRPGLVAALGRCGVESDTNVEARREVSAPSASEIEFLKTFDVDFRVRRLRYIIRRLNELYHLAITSPEIKSKVEQLDDLKTTLYGMLDDIKTRWTLAFYETDAFASLLDAKRDGRLSADVFAGALSQIGEAMALVEFDDAADEIFAIMVLNYIPVELRRDLFTAYLGFSFFDVMSFPMVQWDDLDELEEVLIDRISPVDAVAIRQGGTSAILRGIALRNFGGFFNRAYRDNDYLWGRLNAADRLVDIVLGAVNGTGDGHNTDAHDVKHRLFAAILDAEEPHLKADPDLITTLRREIAALKG